MRIGDTVRAKFRISEELFGERVVHAESGEFGTVLDLVPGCLPTVRFRESGSVYDCSPDEIERVEKGDDRTPQFVYVTCKHCEGHGRVIQTERLGHGASVSALIKCPACEGFTQDMVRL